MAFRSDEAYFSCAGARPSIATGALVALALFSFGCSSIFTAKRPATPTASAPAAEKPAAPTVSAPSAEKPAAATVSAPTAEKPATPTGSTPAAEKPAAPTASTPASATPPQSDNSADPSRGVPTNAPPAAPNTRPTAPAAALDIPLRTIGDNRISTQLALIAEAIEKENLAYRADLGQDCSGIYHLIKTRLKEQLPSLGNKSKYAFPEFSTERSSRAIARWYHDHQNLHIIDNGKADANRIRPGSVMFFSNTDQRYANMDIDLLAGNGNAKGAIMHIAIVTAVERDPAGNVLKYTMMHGRNTKYPASRSSGNCDCGATTGKQHEKFPFGNWNQQWVAVANIETPVK